MSKIKTEHHDAIENGIRGDTFQLNIKSGKIVRVVYSYSKRKHFISQGYIEVIKQAQDLTNEWLREVYNDPAMSTYEFIRGIQKKNHNFKQTDVLYFYILQLKHSKY